MRLAAVVAAAAAALVLGTQASARPACTAGVKTAGGATYRTFCGPAKVFLSLHTRDYRFDNGGECSRGGGAFSVNIGTISIPPAKPKYTYFGITVFTTHAGTFRNAAVTWQFPGKRGSLIGATVTIARGMKKGTFSGKVLGGTTLARGSFTC